MMNLATPCCEWIRRRISLVMGIWRTVTVMPAAGRLYPYVGPLELREPGREPSGIAVNSPVMLAAWLGARGRDELAEPFTFTVSAGGDLLLAPRRREHVHRAPSAGPEQLSV